MYRELVPLFIAWTKDLFVVMATSGPPDKFRIQLQFTEQCHLPCYKVIIPSNMSRVGINMIRI